MPRGTSRIFREKVRSAAKVLGVDGTDFRNAGREFIEDARDGYSDLGFSVGAAGRSSRQFRAELELANAELGISPVPAFTPQTMSLDFDAGSEKMGTVGDVTLGLANSWTIAIWRKGNQILGNAGNLFEANPIATNNSLLSIKWVNFFGNGGISLALRDSSAVEIQNVIWAPTGLTTTLWHHLVFQWGGTPATRKWYLDGVDQGIPANLFTNLSGTMADDARQIIIGDSGGFDGRGASIASWPTILSGAEIVALFNSRSINFDLAADQGAYVSSGVLNHWWEMGKQASPNLGADSVVAGGIDIELGAFGMTDADRVADVP